MLSCIPFRRSSLPIRVTDQMRFVTASTLIASLGLSAFHSARIFVVKAVGSDAYNAGGSSISLNNMGVRVEPGWTFTNCITTQCSAL